MRILIATEFGCSLVDGKYYLPPQLFTIFQRYANFFGNMHLLARCFDCEQIPFDYKSVNFIKSIARTDNLIASLLYLNDRAIDDIVKNCDLIIGRLPSIIAYRAFDAAKKYHKKYLAELMCDGWLSYWHHGLLGKIIAPYMHYKMKEVTYGADYAIYVTKNFLQERYPCKNISTISASNVVLDGVDENVVANRIEKLKKFVHKNREVRIITTADVNVESKGQHYVIKAIPFIVKQGVNVKYFLIGGGSQERLRIFAKHCGVEKRIVFLGRLDRVHVFEELDKADIYVQPSLQEGLPRSMVEAMSRGCPCLGARTAGIPELIAPECIFEPKSAKSFAETFLNFIHGDLVKYAKDNFEHSKDYLSEKLDKKREEYFEYIKQEMLMVNGPIA